MYASIHKLFSKGSTNEIYLFRSVPKASAITPIKTETGLDNALSCRFFGVLAVYIHYNAYQPILTVCRRSIFVDRYFTSFCQFPPDKAKAAASVAMKRIMERQTIPTLRQYQKGIYYLTEQTVFGETEINRDKLLAVKYMLPERLLCQSSRFLTPTCPRAWMP